MMPNTGARKGSDGCREGPPHAPRPARRKGPHPHTLRCPELAGASPALAAGASRPGAPNQRADDGGFYIPSEIFFIIHLSMFEIYATNFLR